MQKSDVLDSSRLGLGLIALGAALTAMAMAGAAAALDHMSIAAGLCGPGVGHCVLCAVSASSLLAAAGVIGSGAMLLKTRPPLGHARQATTRRD